MEVTTGNELQVSLELTHGAVTPRRQSLAAGVVGSARGCVLHRREISTGRGILKPVSHGRAYPRHGMDRPGDRDDLEQHGAIGVASHDEGLLTLLGMHRERPVREAEPRRLVNDCDDPAGRVDEPDQKRCAERNVRTDSDRSISREFETSAAVDGPRADRIATSIERVHTGELAAPLPAAQSHRGRSAERTASRRERELIGTAREKQRVEFVTCPTMQMPRHELDSCIGTLRRPATRAGGPERVSRGQHMRIRSAFAKLLVGLAAASLLMTIAFLAVAPANPFNYPTLGCGAPAAWYFNGRPDPMGNRVVAFGPTGTSAATTLPPTCQDLVDARLHAAGVTGGITVALLAASALIGSRQRVQPDRRWSPAGTRARQRLTRHRSNPN